MTITTQIPMFEGELQPGEFAYPQSTPCRCQSCGEVIVWTRTPAGKAIPLTVASAREVNGQRVAMTHFVDCPHSKEWKRG